MVSSCAVAMVLDLEECLDRRDGSGQWISTCLLFRGALSGLHCLLEIAEERATLWQRHKYGFSFHHVLFRKVGVIMARIPNVDSAKIPSIPTSNELPLRSKCPISEPMLKHAICKSHSSLRVFGPMTCLKFKSPAGSEV